MPDQQPTPGRLLLVTLGAFLLCFLLGSALVTLVFTSAGVDILGIQAGTAEAPDRTALRLGLLLNNLFLFAGTALVAFGVVYRGRWAAAAGLTQRPRPGFVTPAVVLALLSLPVVGYAAYLNLRVDLPAWAERGEASTNALLEYVLRMDDLGELALSLLTIAVVAGVGEELLLRGVVQRRILGPWLGHHGAIWLAAGLFSAMHFEFAGFLPRLLLGAVLGYAYYWTNSLWVPILLHVVFNGVQVVVTYVTEDFVPDTEISDVPPWYLALLALGLALWLGYRTERRLSPSPSSGAAPSPPGSPGT